MRMKYTDILALASRTVRSNKLRTGITISIIAFGIMALIGIITAIKAMNQKLTESFSSMGRNGFIIAYKQRNLRIGNDNCETILSRKTAKKQKQSRLNKIVTQDQAGTFLQLYECQSTAGISAFPGNNAIVSYQSQKT